MLIIFRNNICVLNICFLTFNSFFVFVFIFVSFFIACWTVISCSYWRIFVLNAMRSSTFSIFFRITYSRYEIHINPLLSVLWIHVVFLTTSNRTLDMVQYSSIFAVLDEFSTLYIGLIANEQTYMDNYCSGKCLTFIVKTFQKIQHDDSSNSMKRRTHKHE